ncbi:MAG: helicase-exonuclease AddAB subunit AddA [Roseburia sp.]|nr:helicase-exonuclease AddAB subunit AddA [Roseburia sp.]
MAMNWTPDQQKVIDLRNRNILVSAAAGSGKTAVLVERIIKIITDKKHPVDIDRLLIVTFTNAAAAEMRERIGAAIEKALEENEADEHLQRQLTLIHNAQITTIDSFCLYVVRNHFYEIDMEPNFRIGDEGELKLLREDVIKEVLAAHYEQPEGAFSDFMEGYASGRSDDAAVDMILGLYDFSRSYPWPKQWLRNCQNCYAVQSVEDLNEAVWMQPAVKNMQQLLRDICKSMELALELANEPDGPNMYCAAIESDLEIYESLAELDSFTKLYAALGNISYARLASSKGYTGSPEKLERVKAIREDAKAVIKKLVHQYCFMAPELMVEQLQKTAPMAATLLGLAEEFADAYAAAKKKKNLVDFHDVEHFALEILVEEETGKAKKTAEEFRDTFAEIMIDEYQDSNYVQEAILTSISRMDRGENNIFMVGDVKQSIYRFRLARPELFMDKYDTYSTDDGCEQRIDLHQNFRSRNEVLETANDIFYRIMGKDLGNVVYDDLAALYPGASYPAAEDVKAELLLIDSNDELLEDTEFADKKLFEAKLVASRIKKLLRDYKVTDKKTGELRATRCSDIVILLRSLSGWAESFAQVLNDEGIPAHAVSQTGYFSAVEVQTVLSMLRILDNPRQDIPLAGVLRSPIGGFSDEELAVLRLYKKEEPFHVSVLELCKHLELETPTNVAEEKLLRFYRTYKQLRSKVADTPIHELVELVLKDTGYGNYVAAMPSGARRRANIDMLLEKAIAYEKTSYKGLFHFVRYIDELQKYDVDFGEADLIGENEDVVRIMSIHKSKGLEFPVVFVSGLGKNFNKQDTRSRMVLHPEYGVGLDAMDGKRRVKAPTIAKRAIAKQIDLENLGEELRVLYVALTRAKEKLILTGSKKGIIEKIDAYAQEMQGLGLKPGELLPYLKREGAASYLDWIIPAFLSYDEKYPITCVSAEELVTEEVEKQVLAAQKKSECRAEIESADDKLLMELEERFRQHYPYATDIARKNKYSVSELKHRAMREAFEAEDADSTPLFAEEVIVPYVPKFMREAAADATDTEDVNQGALRGTAVHRVMECYDFTSELWPKEQIQEMLSSGRITEELKQLVHVQKVQAFVASDTGKRMKQAALRGQLYREKPFVMGFSEEELAENGFLEESTEEAVAAGEEDLTLIQGIIDVFWIEEDGIVLLDYKTDSVKTPEELVKRYEAQLNLYAEALNRVFAENGLKVKEKLIYAFKFGEVITL